MHYYIYFVLVRSFNLGCDLMFYDLAIPIDLMQDLDSDNLAYGD